MSRPATPQEKKVFGVVMLGIGGGICAIAAGAFPSLLSGANAPMAILLAAGGIFLIAGLLLLTEGRRPEWAGGLLTNLMLTLFAVIPAWIALDGDPAAFSASFSLAALSIDFRTGAIIRLAFGAAALLLSLLSLFVWLHWLRKLSWSARGYFTSAALLAWYGLFVWLPAEPRWPDLADDHARLARYSLMVEDGGWGRIEGSGPRRSYFPPWRNLEDWTKAARDRLAAARQAPPDGSVLTIPRIATAPTIDGRIADDEWRGAMRMRLPPEDSGSTVLVAADATRLYLAADVTADTTAAGFDQFRFWFHTDLSPWLHSERVHLHSAGYVTGLRLSRYPWGEHAPRQRTDWRIYQKARGATTVTDHRRYEMALDLAEIGIKPGVPFPGWMEVEGDPLYDQAGKFRARTYHGRGGSHEAPLWMRVAPP